MKYRDFIQKNFLIDEPKTGRLVPFVLNKVQNKYYDSLNYEHQIEDKGITSAIREIVLKARREGMSSLILGLFAADDITNKQPTNTQVISYRDDATKTFIRRYKNFVLSSARRMGVEDPFLTENGGEMVLRHNGARFFAGTASARVGERGGTLQKLLFTEAAHFPDTEILTAKEIIEGTIRQIDIASGWVFVESTANGLGNHYAEMWKLSTRGESRFKGRFFSWQEFYTKEEFDIICSEFTDKLMIKQEYPATPEEAFLASATNFTALEKIEKLIGYDKNNKKLFGWLKLEGTNYIEQCEIIRDWLLQLEKMQNKSFYVGIDVAKHPDRTVVTILSDRITNWEAKKIKCIAIDTTGIGDYMPDWFEKNSRWYIHKVKFSTQQKDVLYKNLMQVIEGKLTELPSLDTDEGRLFKTEVLDLQKEYKGEMMSVHHPEGNYHDDFPDSWALAEISYVFINGVEKMAKPSESPQDRLKLTFGLIDDREKLKEIQQETYE